MTDEMKNTEQTEEEQVLEDIEEIDSNLEAVQEELEEDSNKEKDKDFQELETRYLRLQADFNNYKKRVEKEKESIYTFAKEGLIKDLLAVIDNFERGFQTADEKVKEDSFYTGIEMVYKQLIATLEKSGLEKIEALGQEFDPNLHQAVMHEESDEHDTDIISQEFQKGYKLKDRVIRPSMVKVAK